MKPSGESFNPIPIYITIHRNVVDVSITSKTNTERDEGTQCMRENTVNMIFMQ